MKVEGSFYLVGNLVYVLMVVLLLLVFSIMLVCVFNGISDFFFLELLILFFGIGFVVVFFVVVQH